MNKDYPAHQLAASDHYQYAGIINHEDKNKSIWFKDIAAEFNALLTTQQEDRKLIKKLVEALKNTKAKLETGPTTQSLIMRAWDTAKALIIEIPDASMPREIFESIIEELIEEMAAAIALANQRLVGGICNANQH